MATPEPVSTVVSAEPVQKEEIPTSTSPEVSTENTVSSELVATSDPIEKEIPENSTVSNTTDSKYNFTKVHNLKVTDAPNSDKKSDFLRINTRAVVFVLFRANV